MALALAAALTFAATLAKTLALAVAAVASVTAVAAVAAAGAVAATAAVVLALYGGGGSVGVCVGNGRGMSVAKLCCIVVVSVCRYG